MEGPAQIFEWQGTASEISIRRILKVHGYRDLQRVRRPILLAAEKAAERARLVAEPQAVWRRCKVEALEEHGLRLVEGARFTGATFGRVLGSAREVAPFVLTLGADYDAAISALMQEEPVMALFLDTAGWLSVERATRDLARDIDAALAPGLRTGSRLGPGYDYRGETGRHSWPLQEQQELFRLFEGAPVPVTLLESCAMMPKMSRSGLFAVSENHDTALEEREGASSQ